MYFKAIKFRSTKENVAMSILQGAFFGNAILCKTLRDEKTYFVKEMYTHILQNG